MINNKTKFDLEERTAKFGQNILLFCKSVYLNTFNESLIKQLIRSSTSIGANYMEANGSDSRRDFKNKISTCKKEQLRDLWKEAQQFVLIFSSIVKKV